LPHLLSKITQATTTFIVIS